LTPATAIGWEAVVGTGVGEVVCNFVGLVVGRGVGFGVE